MRVLVLGGDGYCGWPTALRLSALGMDVSIVDNLSRREIALELKAPSLVPIADLNTRCAAWEDLAGRVITTYHIDIAEDFDAICTLIGDLRPEAIVHFAEQRSVPYSAMSAHAGLYTVRNNLMATTNVLMAMVETGVDAHLVHLGSLGVYGYETLGYEIPEGYLEVRRLSKAGGLGPKEEILQPFNPVSIYHLTKALDHLGLAHFASRFGVRATDLHQGTVWGSETLETVKDPRLANRFDYDPTYGTVINRFAVQAALNMPISIYGTGGQTRGFSHVNDVLSCGEAALLEPPARGERVRVINQTAETRQIRDLAEIFAGLSKSEIKFLPSPRKEPAANDLRTSNESVIGFGVTPTIVSEETAGPLVEAARRMADSVDMSLLYPDTAAIDATQTRS